MLQDSVFHCVLSASITRPTVLRLSKRQTTRNITYMTSTLTTDIRWFFFLSEKGHWLSTV